MNAVIASSVFMRDFAKALGWEVKEVNDQGIYREDFLKIDGRVESIGFSFYTPEIWKGLGRPEAKPDTVREGYIINPARPFHTESINWWWVQHDGWYELSSFCKTQVFSDREMPNLYAHIILVSMLQTVKSTWLPDMEISDEGYFYLPMDPEERRAYIDEHIAEGYREIYHRLQPWNFQELSEAHTGLRTMISGVVETLGKMFGDTPFKAVSSATKPDTEDRT